MEVYVAKQPIFDEKGEVFAYELFHRSNEENLFSYIDGDQATADVIINSFLNIGIDKLSEGKLCFINFTEKLLQLRLPTYFSPREIVVEILESVQPSVELIQICTELKRQGYQIALDDFVLKSENPYSNDLLSLADYVKVDFLITTKEMRRKIEKAVRKLEVKLIAERIETNDAFEEAKLNGYESFQGYYFAMPTIISTRDVPPCSSSYYDMIYQMCMREPNINVITDLIERDISLSYKLLKLINGSGNRTKQKIHSIRQAITLLGIMEIQKWIFVLMLREKTIERKEVSKEVLQVCFIRAKMCDSIQRLRTNVSTDGYFMVGMLSLMDSILSTPMENVISELPLNTNIIDALNGVQNSMREVLDLVIAVENAEWSFISSQCKELSIDEKDLFKIYAETLNTSNQIVAI